MWTIQLFLWCYWHQPVKLNIKHWTMTICVLKEDGAKRIQNLWEVSFLRMKIFFSIHHNSNSVWIVVTSSYHGSLSWRFSWECAGKQFLLLYDNWLTKNNNGVQSHMIECCLSLTAHHALYFLVQNIYYQWSQIYIFSVSFREKPTVFKRKKVKI